jgi:hypothetical protein
MPEFDQLGNPSRGFEYRVIEFDVRITPGGAVQYFMPDTWWELGSWIPYENAVAQVIAHTGLDVKGPGVNQGTIMYEGYFKGGKFFASCHLSGLQVDPEPTMDIYWNLDGPVKLDFSMVMDVCDGCSGSPWDDDLPWE